MKEKISPHLKHLMEISKAIFLQFKKRRFFKKKNYHYQEDPLGEDIEFGKMKGLVHKYPNRALVKTTFYCASHCQFCTRVRQIGSSEGDLTDTDVDRIILYIKEHKEISDVILSGGDPMMVPELTSYFVRELVKIESVKVIRIGTRFPIHSPSSFKADAKKIWNLLDELKKANKEKTVYFLVHVNHVDELTSAVWDIFLTIQGFGINIGTQTVFLKNVNDNVNALSNLFKELYEGGVRPYYIYHCDHARGIEHFVVPLRKERKIMTELHKKLPGLALPKFVIDAPNGSGKIPVSLNFWKNLRTFFDYLGKEIRI